MKRLSILFLVSLVIPAFGFSQILFSRMINFETNGQYAVINPNQPGNIWQKGSPHKTFFDSAYSLPYAIITDSSGLYPVNNLSDFTVKMNSPQFGCWGMGWLRFMHKYDMDDHHAGGYIEVSYDTSSVFHNIIFDTLEPLPFGFQTYNFYNANDTITGGIPAFTGNSGNWVYSTVWWIWEIGVKKFQPEHDSLRIRFSFKSDGVAVPAEGWMIDDIWLEIDDCTGSIDEHNSNKRVSIYPHPVTDEASFALINFPPGVYEMTVYDALGNVAAGVQTVHPPSFKFRNPGLVPGIYFYRISGHSGETISGKLGIR
jgi:hypothetical protein